MPVPVSAMLNKGVVVSLLLMRSVVERGPLPKGAKRTVKVVKPSGDTVADGAAVTEKSVAFPPRKLAETPVRAL